MEKRNEKDGSSFALLTFESKERFLSLFPFFFLAMGDFVDHELLLSVASGIGRWVDGPGGAVYERDEDCLGEEGKRKFFLISFFFRLISTMPMLCSPLPLFSLISRPWRSPFPASAAFALDACDRHSPCCDRSCEGGEEKRPA